MAPAEFDLAGVLLEPLAHPLQTVAAIDRRGAATIVMGVECDAIGTGFESNPQVARVGVSRRVRDDLLHAPNQRIGARGVGHAKRGRHIEMDHYRGLARAQLTNRLDDVDATRLPQAADHVADVGEQQPRDRVRLPDKVSRLPLSQPRGDVEMQAERGQVVAERVVQVTRDTKALGVAAVLGDALTTVEGMTFFVAALGFQVFAASSSILAISEARARNDFARANAELTATRELLAENSRTSERLRISRDLHDTLGHHLTALSLQLDVATRLSEGRAAEHVQQAHAVTRLLLSDVRNVVSSLRESSKLNLADAIKALAIQPVEARVHLDLPESLIVEDAARAETLLRAVQEVLTNTARHACAQNLWIRLEPTGSGIMLTARDDGQGTNVVSFGNGLRGMKERFQEHGGRVDVESGAGAGFEVRAFLPVPSSA